MFTSFEIDFLILHLRNQLRILDREITELEAAPAKRPDAPNRQELPAVSKEARLDLGEGWTRHRRCSLKRRASSFGNSG